MWCARSIKQGNIYISFSSIRNWQIIHRRNHGCVDSTPNVSSTILATTVVSSKTTFPSSNSQYDSRSLCLSSSPFDVVFRLQLSHTTNTSCQLAFLLSTQAMKMPSHGLPDGVHWAQVVVSLDITCKFKCQSWLTMLAKRNSVPTCSLLHKSVLVLVVLAKTHAKVTLVVHWSSNMLMVFGTWWVWHHG